jgi:hypothetical protein
MTRTPTCHDPIDTALAVGRHLDGLGILHTVGGSMCQLVCALGETSAEDR